MQGAKPGEGGELPDIKCFLKSLRLYNTRRRSDLSPTTPRHILIEDLAELIHDLKNSNIEARVNVKLVSEVGVGTIAAGVAKAKADGILVSLRWRHGHHHALHPARRCSMGVGLIETNQTLLLNDLRSRVRLD